MKLKQIIRFIIYRFPLNKLLFNLVKKIYIPSDSLRDKLRFVGKFKASTNEGKEFYLYNNGFKMESEIFWLGFEKYNWEVQSRKIWKSLCQSSDIIFDIGANVGIFSILAKVYNPRASVYSFEPQPNIYNVLKKSVTLNGFDTQCENIALSNKSGKMKFYNYGPLAFEGNTTAGSLNSNFRPDDQKSIMVEVKELKQYIEEKKIEKIDLIKMDVETHEYEVLLGYGPYLKVHEPIFLIEIMDESIGKNVESLISSEEYLYYNIDDVNGLVAVKNLGLLEENNNYLLCPKSKLNKIEKFLNKTK
jgi:FkbM family methyltransferase